MGMLLWIGFALVSIYTWIPSLLVRFFHIRGIKQGNRILKTVALTFDDGPNEQYTPVVLDILKKYKVQATFFVVGQQAQKHPELLIRMHEDGHEVAVHGWHHWPSWILSPARTRLEIEQTSELIFAVTGRKPVFFRPPWGLVNGYQFLAMPSLGMKMMLWKVMAYDWRQQKPAYIARRLLKQVRNGAVILLHDNSDTLGAQPKSPETVIQALPIVLDEMVRRGWRFVIASELEPQSKAESMIHRLWKYFWHVWELVIDRVLRLEPVIVNQASIFRIRAHEYQGPDQILRDGTQIQKGDVTIELHLNNDAIETMMHSKKTAVQVAVWMIREIRRSLPILIQYLEASERFSNYKAIYGTTLLHRGTEMLGFTVSDLGKGLSSMFVKWYLRLVMGSLHPEGIKRLQLRKDQLTPKTIWMSKAELLRLYGDPSSSQDIVVS